MFEKFEIKEDQFPIGIIYVDENDGIGLSIPFGEILTDKDLEKLQEGLDIISKVVVEAFDKLND